MTKQFGFGQGLGQGGAVDSDKRLRAARAFLVNGLGQQFLARAAFAKQQQGDIGAGGDAGRAYETEEGRGIA